MHRLPARRHLFWRHLPNPALQRRNLPSRMLQRRRRLRVRNEHDLVWQWRQGLSSVPARRHLHRRIVSGHDVQLDELSGRVLQQRRQLRVGQQYDGVRDRRKRVPALPTRRLVLGRSMQRPGVQSDDVPDGLL
jgi:hypothetical protein